jgi:hypothetical protein
MIGGSDGNIDPFKGMNLEFLSKGALINILGNTPNLNGNDNLTNVGAGTGGVGNSMSGFLGSTSPIGGIFGSDGLPTFDPSSIQSNPVLSTLYDNGVFDQQIADSIQNQLSSDNPFAANIEAFQEWQRDNDLLGDSGAVGDSLAGDQMGSSLANALFAPVVQSGQDPLLANDDKTFEDILAEIQQQATSQAVTGTGDLAGGLQVLGGIFGDLGGALGDKAKGVVDFVLDILDGVELVETDPATGKPTVIIDDTLGNIWDKAKEGWEAIFGDGSWSASGGGGEPSSGALEGIFGPLIGAGVAVATKDSQDTTEAPVTPQDTTGGAADVPENIGSTGTKGTDGGFNADRNSDDPTITGTPTTPRPTTISSGPQDTQQKETDGTFRPDETGGRPTKNPIGSSDVVKTTPDTELPFPGYGGGIVDVNSTPIVDEILGTTTISSGTGDTQEKQEPPLTPRPDETGYNLGIQDGDNEQNPDDDETPLIIDPPNGGGGAGGFGGFSGGARASGGGGASGSFDQPALNRRVNANEGLLSMGNLDYLRQLQERMYGQ